MNRRHTKIGGDANTFQDPADQDKSLNIGEIETISAWLNRDSSSSNQTLLEELDVSSLIMADGHYVLVEHFRETRGNEIILLKFLECLRIEGVLEMFKSESTIFQSVLE